MHARLDCQNHLQRLQFVALATTFSGSRRRDPGTLRSRRTSDVQIIHDRLTGILARKCSRQWLCESGPKAKIAAFFLKKAEGFQQLGQPSAGETSGVRASGLSTFFVATRLGARAEHFPPFYDGRTALVT
jgi:hypothetical protein